MKYFNLHTHHFTNQSDILELVNQYPWEFNQDFSVFSIGIHPWYIKEERLDSDLEFIKVKLQDGNCLALGECGLDKRIEISMELQQTVFEKQLVLAQQFQKPVVIHCVAAFDELLAAKKKMGITVPVIIHGFSKSAQLAKQLIDNGCYLSFGKYLLRNPELESVFKGIPNNRFFLETDTIAESLEEVYALAAKFKNITVTELQQFITINYKTVFNQ
ncbi:TatD family hydrolase [Flavobacterium faecale]|uniref:TatD family hydrolase n=1 Tax=Flavobacterium faecale TaxID=1355330 RepID=UPI003AABAA0D